MRHALLCGKLLVHCYLLYLLYVLAFQYDPTNVQFHPPIVIVMIDWIDLFIHEAGHFFFKIFGQTIYVLGGSLMQVLLPTGVVVYSFIYDRRWMALPLFWTGESMVNVSVYIQDAANQRLPLLARGLIHDWNWLLDGDADQAEILGGIVFWLGIAVCATGICLGIIFAIQIFRATSDTPSPIEE